MRTVPVRSVDTNVNMSAEMQLVHFPKELDDEWWVFPPHPLLFQFPRVYPASGECTTFCPHHRSCSDHLTSSPSISITASTYLPQPPGKTAIVSGLNYTSRIFALLGEILVRIRVDKRSPPQGQFATARLEEVQALHSRIMAALAHTPENLRLKPVPHVGSPMNGAVGTGSFPPEFGGPNLKATFAEVRDFFDNPNASRTNALNPFLVMQANLYVTQVWCIYLGPRDRAVHLAPLHSNLFDSLSNNTGTS